MRREGNRQPLRFHISAMALTDFVTEKIGNLPVRDFTDYAFSRFDTHLFHLYASERQCHDLSTFINLECEKQL